MEKYIFYILALIMIVAAIASVASRKMLRSVIYLLFVLVGAAGIYFLIDYNFLAAIQLTVYAGGIIVLIIFFQVFVIREKVNHPERLVAGFGFVLLGLALFLLGLEMALFPIGKMMAAQLTDPEFIAGSSGLVEALTWEDYYWVYLFAFMIGFSTTIAEPSLLAVAIKAEEISGGTISIWGLRIAVAIGVAVGISLGAYRIVTGIPLEYFIISGYIVVVIQTWFAPRLIVPLAYDSGGVTTSTVTVPLVAALGLGLADTIPGRSVLIDGFGLIAFASLFPIISVMAYAQLSEFRCRRKSTGE